MQGGLVRGTALAVLALSVVGCSNVRQQLGFDRPAPDEFQVVRRAPLIMPPDYSLRPPEPGAPPAFGGNPTAEAQSVLTGQPIPAAGSVEQSTAETAIVQASPVQAAPSIRQQVAEENRELTTVDDSTFLFIFDFQKKAMLQAQNPNEVVNAPEEQARLRSLASGAVVTTTRTGSVPLPPS